MSESAVSAKVRLVLIGTRSARSETPVRVAAERRPPDKGRSGKRLCGHQYVKPGVICDLGPCTRWFLSQIKL